MSILKAHHPKTRIVVGGRWVIDDQAERMKSLVPLADIIVPGFGEDQLINVLNIPRNSSLNYSQKISLSHSNLDYSLLHERELYQPSIEISRGCGMGCSFCQERDKPLSKLKSVSLISGELEKTLQKDGLIKMNPYFEASRFTPNGNWIDSLILSRDIHQHNYLWRAEARVDSLNPHHLKRLKCAGLHILDLGLESADPNQLLNMKKTKNPEAYLLKASDLLQATFEAGIHVKINILLYAGETFESIENTIQWLDSHKHMITGVSVGPIVIFGWPHRINSYLSELLRFGATVSHDAVFGAKHINLSQAIDYERSIQISKDIGRRYTTAQNYYFLKSFSYFARDYDYDQFKSDCIGIENLLYFSIDNYDSIYEPTI